MKKRLAFILLLACLLAVPGFSQVRDLHYNISCIACVTPQTMTTGTVWGATVDMRDYRSVEFIIQTGTIVTSTATYTVTLWEKDQPQLEAGYKVISGEDVQPGHTNSTEVAAKDILGTTTAASFTGANDNSIYRLGYVGTKRFVWIKIVPANNAAGGLVSCVAVRGGPHIAPVNE